MTGPVIATAPWSTNASPISAIFLEALSCYEFRICPSMEACATVPHGLAVSGTGARHASGTYAGSASGAWSAFT